MQKLLVRALAGLLVIAFAPCGASSTEVFFGAVVDGVADESNEIEEGGKSENFRINVRKGLQLYVHLSSTDSNVLGLWDADKQEYLMEANQDALTRTTRHTYDSTGFHNFCVRTADSKIDSSFTFKFTIPPVSSIP